MSFPTKRRLALALAVTASLMAGCGTQPATPSATAPDPAYQTLQDGTTAQPDDTATTAPDADRTATKRDKLSRLLKGVDLTAEQQSRLDTIRSQFDPGVTKADLTGWKDRFVQLMQADTVDKEALSTLAGEVSTKVQTLESNAVDMLADVRDVLTDAQRQQVATNLLDKIGRHGRMKHKNRTERMCDDLNLTQAQKDALKALHMTSRTQKTAALASFFLTGDKQALKDALTPSDMQSRIDNAVDALAGMSKDTRQALVDCMQKWHDKKTHKPAPAEGGTDDAMPSAD